MSTRFDGHTPGPWVEDDGFIHGADRCLAQPPPYEGTEGWLGEMDPNAALIAAAPELLKAGQSLADALESYTAYLYAHNMLGDNVMAALAAWRAAVGEKP